MKTSANCLQLIKHFESCRLHAYPDPKTGGAPFTIGFGATGLGIGSATSWMQSQADQRLVEDIAEREDDANAAIKVAVTQGEFDAFVSILFNVGHGSPAKDGIIRLRSGYPSTLLRLLNAKDFAGARAQFSAWVSPGSSVENGLRRRRRAEQALFDGKTAEQAIAIAA